MPTQSIRLERPWRLRMSGLRPAALRTLALVGILSGALVAAGAPPGSAATCETWGAQPPNVGTNANQLDGVAVTSACNAWASGLYYTGSRTLVLRWNGTAWNVQPSPNVGSGNNLVSAVAAISASSAWAVGYHTTTVNRTLVLHCC
jgi:hypothetical protein